MSEAGAEAAYAARAASVVEAVLAGVAAAQDDPLGTAMRRDPASAAFYEARLREVLLDALSNEQERALRRLLEENAGLRAEALEQRDRADTITRRMASIELRGVDESARAAREHEEVARLREQAVLAQSRAESATQSAMECSRQRDAAEVECKRLRQDVVRLEASLAAANELSVELRRIEARQLEELEAKDKRLYDAVDEAGEHARIAKGLADECAALRDRAVQLDEASESARTLGAALQTTRERYAALKMRAERVARSLARSERDRLELRQKYLAVGTKVEALLRAEEDQNAKTADVLRTKLERAHHALVDERKERNRERRLLRGKLQEMSVQLQQRQDCVIISDHELRALKDRAHQAEQRSDETGRKLEDSQKRMQTLENTIRENEKVIHELKAQHRDQIIALERRLHEEENRRRNEIREIEPLLIRNLGEKVDNVLREAAASREQVAKALATAENATETLKASAEKQQQRPSGLQYCRLPLQQQQQQLPDQSTVDPFLEASSNPVFQLALQAKELAVRAAMRDEQENWRLQQRRELDTAMKSEVEKVRDESVRDLNRANDDIKKLREEVNDLQERLAAAQLEASRMTRARDEVQATLEPLRKTVQLESSRRTSLCRHLDEASRSIARLQALVEQEQNKRRCAEQALLEQSIAAENLRKTATREHNALTQRLEAGRALEQKLSEDAARAQKECERASKALEQQRDLAQELVDEEVALHERLREAEKARATACEQAVGSAAALQAFQSTCATTAREREMEFERWRDQAKHDVERVEREWNHRLDEMKQQVEAHKRIVNTEQQRQAQREQISQKKRDKVIRAVGAMTREWRHELGLLSTEMKTGTQSICDDVQRALKTIHVRSVALRKAGKQADKERRKLQCELESSRNELAQAASSEREAHLREIASLQSQIQSRDEELSIRAAEVSVARDRALELTQKLESVERALLVLEDERDRMNETIQKGSDRDTEWRKESETRMKEIHDHRFAEERERQLVERLRGRLAAVLTVLKSEIMLADGLIDRLLFVRPITTSETASIESESNPETAGETAVVALQNAVRKALCKVVDKAALDAKTPLEAKLAEERARVAALERELGRADETQLALETQLNRASEEVEAALHERDEAHDAIERLTIEWQQHVAAQQFREDIASIDDSSIVDPRPIAIPVASTDWSSSQIYGQPTTYMEQQDYDHGQSTHIDNNFDTMSMSRLTNIRQQQQYSSSAPAVAQYFDEDQSIGDVLNQNEVGANVSRSNAPNRNLNLSQESKHDQGGPENLLSETSDKLPRSLSDPSPLVEQIASLEYHPSGIDDRVLRASTIEYVDISPDESKPIDEEDAPLALKDKETNAWTSTSSSIDRRPELIRQHVEDSLALDYETAQLIERGRILRRQASEHLK